MAERTGAAPEGHTSVAPWVVTDGTGAFLDFVAQAFAGEELGRVAVEDGVIGHGETRVGDTVVLAFDRRADRPVLPSLLRVFVADADTAFSRAVAAGGQVVTPLSDNTFGQRGGRVKDPFGNIRWVVRHVEEVSEDEMGKRLRDPGYAEGMRVARVTPDAELTGRCHGRGSAPVRTAGRPGRRGSPRHPAGVRRRSPGPPSPVSR
ncbi:VOC family protein [Streptomyces sp. NRRL S-37]|uniref:VOC family protein n=1 Tax=Streptomyces sp. NRRL S-37 TaxID=1463903 RepID=UPI003B63E52B